MTQLLMQAGAGKNNEQAGHAILPMDLNVCNYAESWDTW